jgi:hypothetical protein
MEIGMMWLMDNSKTAQKKHHGLLEDITTAAEYYLRKYGSKPNAVYANPTNVEKEEEMATRSLLKEIGLELVLARNILKGNLWIGIENNE